MPQAARYSAVWMGGGAIQAAKAVTVRNALDTADATVYTSTAGTASGSNPVTTDADGVLVAYLAAGRYLLKDAAGDRMEITVAVGTDAVVRVVPSVVGIRSSNTALASLLTVLATAGLIVDNTTAT